MLTFELDVPREQTAHGVVANGRITGLFIAAGIDETKERIEENLRCLLEGNAFVVDDIRPSLFVIQMKAVPLASASAILVCHPGPVAFQRSITPGSTPGQ